jgi:DNA-binding response OmpR family regulator
MNQLSTGSSYNRPNGYALGTERTAEIIRPTSTPTTGAERSSENQTQVLVVEDDEALRRLLDITLKRDGYRVITAGNGQEALQLFADHPVDIVLLDVNMPVMNGYAVCAELRKQTHVPIIFLTAKSRMDDLVTGLELGADNYVTKPFTIQELRARIRAILQRVQTSVESEEAKNITIGEITLNDESMEVTVGGAPINLTPSEFRLLSYLMHHPDKLITKEEFLSAVWDYQSAEDVNFMRVTIRRLRSKIEQDPANPRYLKTVHGLGYQFCSEALHRHS